MLLHNADPIVQEHAAGTLFNLSMESRTCKAILRAAGALPSLLVMLNSTNVATAEHAESIRHSLSALPNYGARVAAALVPLCNMLRSSVVVTHEYALELLCYLVSYSDGACCPVNALLHIPPAHHSLTDMKRQAYQAGILPPLIQLLTTSERMVLQNSITTMRKLSLLPELKVALMAAGAMFVCSPVPRFFILFIV